MTYEKITKLTENKNLCVIIPALNAEKTIAKVINDIKLLYGKIPIIVVSDGSEDRTEEIARDLGCLLISNPRTLGVGGSVKEGIKYALALGMNSFVTIGADDQRDVGDIIKLYQKLNTDKCDIVIGSKFLTIGQRVPFLRKYGSILITFILNKFFKARFSDPLSGFRAFNKRVACDIFGLSDSYAFDIDLCIRVIKKGYTYKEIPVKVFYSGHTSKMKNILFEAARMRSQSAISTQNFRGVISKISRLFKWL